MTVVGLTVQELIPSLDTSYPWDPGDWNTSDTHTVMTYSSVKVSTLRMRINFPPSHTNMKISTGHIVTGVIITTVVFLWMTEGPDTSTLLEVWTNDIRPVHDWRRIQKNSRHEDILPTTGTGFHHRSSFWSTTHVLARSLLYGTGPWNHINRDSVIEQVYETSGLPPQACCPNLTCSNETPTVVSDIRLLQPQPSEETSTITSERYRDCFCPTCWFFHTFGTTRMTCETGPSWRVLWIQSRKSGILFSRRVSKDRWPTWKCRKQWTSTSRTTKPLDQINFRQNLLRRCHRNKYKYFWNGSIKCWIEGSWLPKWQKRRWRTN